MTFDDSCIAITVTTCEPGWTSKCYWKQSSKPSLDITREPRLVFVADIFFKTPYIDIHWQSVVVSTFLKLHRGHCLLCYPVVSCGCRAFLSHSPLPEGKREMYRERLRIPKQWQPWRTTGLLWSTWVWRDRSKRTSDHCNCLYIIIISIYIIYIYIIICLLLYVYIYIYKQSCVSHTLCLSPFSILQVRSLQAVHSAHSEVWQSTSSKHLPASGAEPKRNVLWYIKHSNGKCPLSLSFW